MYINFFFIQNKIMIKFTKRLDKLGRVVLPIQVRNKLNLKERSLLEINVRNNEILIKKKEEFGDLIMCFEELCDNFSKFLIIVVVQDRILYSNKLKKEIGLQVCENFKIQLNKLPYEKKQDYIINEKIKINKYLYTFKFINYEENFGFICFFSKHLATLQDKGVMSFLVEYFGQRYDKN